MKQLPFIDGLRALAVIPVILFHFGASLCPGGFVGVDVFFVLSGFLITGVLMDMLATGNFSLVTFYERRARRILPALFVMGVLVLACAWALFMPQDFRSVGQTLSSAALFATNFTFYEQVGYFASPALVRPLLHTWSLAVEEQFYLLYPLILLGLYRWSHRRKNRLTLGIALLFAVSLALNLLFIARSPYATFYLLPARAWELLAGALTWLCLKQVRCTRPAAELASITGLALLVFGIATYGMSTPFPGAAALAPVMGTVLILWSNLQALTGIGRILQWRLLRGIGLISYGLYLYHWPLLVFSRYYLDRDLTVPETMIALALLTGVASASYLLLEQPVRSKRLLRSRRAIVAVSFVGLLAMGGVGSFIVNRDGMPDRFSGRVLQYMTDDAEPAEKCAPLAGSKKGRQQQCSMGIAGSRTDFILWGDSHADALSPGIDALAKEKHLAGVKLWSPGCPPLLSLDHIGTDKYTCAEDAARAMQFIAQHKPKVVILAARWDVAQGGAEKGGMEAIRDAQGPFIKRTKNGTTLYDIEALGIALHDTVDALAAQGIRVVLVKQVPLSRYHVPTALAKAAYVGRDTSMLQRPVDEVLQRRIPIDRVMEGLRATTIDPLQQFCANAECIIEANGRALYRDASHVSVYGALWAKPLWQDMFR